MNIPILITLTPIDKNGRGRDDIDVVLGNVQFISHRYVPGKVRVQNGPGDNVMIQGSILSIDGMQVPVVESKERVLEIIAKAIAETFKCAKLFERAIGEAQETANDKISDKAL